MLEEILIITTALPLQLFPFSDIADFLATDFLI